MADFSEKQLDAIRGAIAQSVGRNDFSLKDCYSTGLDLAGVISWSEGVEQSFNLKIDVLLDEQLSSYAETKLNGLTEQDLSNLRDAIDETYIDKLTRFRSVDLSPNGSIVGVFEDDFVRGGRRVTEKYAFRIDDLDGDRPTLSYKAIPDGQNTIDLEEDQDPWDLTLVESLAVIQFAEPFEFATPVQKKKNCSKGRPCGGGCIQASKTCIKELSPEAARKAKQVKDKLKRKEAGSGENAPLTDRELRSAIYKKFGVRNAEELRKNGSFQMAASGIEAKTPRERLEQVYRRHIGVLPNERNDTSPTAVNGIDVLKYDRPWDVFGLDPRTATDQDIKNAYRRLSKQHHPDAGGNRDVFEKLNTFYRSLTTKF